MQKTKDPLPRLPGWLSVKEAAQLAGRSVGSIRRAIALGDLPARRLCGRILIAAEHGRQFAQLTHPQCQPRFPLSGGEPRTVEEPQARLLTTLTVQLRAGQQEAFDQHLRAIVEQRLPCFPGTLDHAIKRSQSRPDMVLILLVWDASTMPPVEEREAMFAALRADLATVLAWETEERYEQHLLLHTL